MEIKNVFNEADKDFIINRINQLTPNAKAVWGKMSVDQMLAHCNVTYEMVFDNTHPKPDFFFKIILKYLVKRKVVGNSPYSRNSQTAPAFIISDVKNFEDEKERLISYFITTYQLGANHFDGKESLSFGILNHQEWNNMFYKHLDHHLNQFGV